MQRRTLMHVRAGLPRFGNYSCLCSAASMPSFAPNSGNVRPSPSLCHRPRAMVLWSPLSSPLGTSARESQNDDRSQPARGRPGPAAAAWSHGNAALQRRFPDRGFGGFCWRSRGLQEILRRDAGKVRHGFRADPTSRSQAPKPDGRPADQSHTDEGSAGSGWDAGRMRPCL